MAQRKGERPDIIEALTSGKIFGPAFPRPETFAGWQVFLKSVYGIPLAQTELATFQGSTGRDRPWPEGHQETYAIVGRRGGKTRMAALIAAYEALFGDYATRLAAGERAWIFLIATDKAQAGVALGYIKALIELFPDTIEKTLAEEIWLRNRIVVSVKTCSYRATRGFAVAALIADELSFWRDETSANPAAEVISSISPALMPGGKLIGISTPYGRMGYLYELWREFYGKPESDILVWKAPTRTMNPTFDEAIIRRHIARDRTAALAEFNAEFRADIEAFIPEALVDAAATRSLAAPVPGRRYTGFIDAAGGTGTDSFSLAIVHTENDKVVVDRTEERRPSFDPAAICEEYAEILKAYGIRRATSDRYAGAFPASAFAKHGVILEMSPMTASQLYLEFQPLLSAFRVELLNDERLKLQLKCLERRPMPGGQDKITHGDCGDDVANAVAGAVVMAARGDEKWDEKTMEARLPIIQRRALDEKSRLAKDTQREYESMGDEFYSEPGACRIIRRN